MAKKTPKKKTPAKHTLKDEAIDLLRETCRDLRREIRSMKKALQAAEKKELRSTGYIVKAEEDRDVLYDAVRVLAAALSNRYSAQRKAREEARRLLSEAKIPPPATLGSIRNRSRKKTS